MLLGRDAECERIERLVARARAGESGVLVLRGEPGIGKTALLEHAAASAGAATVLRVRGVESEVEVAFGGLHELLRPVLDERERLPPPQRVALERALGLVAGAGPEPQLVGAATLGLLAALAEERPVLVLADDVQWLDGASASALTFAARRLLADAVAVLLTVRAGEPSRIDAAGLDELELTGLAAEPARALLDAHAAHPVAGDTAGWLHEATGGNPLALVELAAEAPRLRPGPVGDHIAVGHRIERALGRRLDRMSDEATRSLLAAAVADGDELEPVLGAARAAGGSLDRARGGRGGGARPPGRGPDRVPPPARPLGGARARGARRAEGRAPRVRRRPGDGTSRAASGGSRGAVAERRAWHLAAGTLEPDEEVAAALAAAATAAGERGGFAGRGRRVRAGRRPQPRAGPAGGAAAAGRGRGVAGRRRAARARAARRRRAPPGDGGGAVRGRPPARARAGAARADPARGLGAAGGGRHDRGDRPGARRGDPGRGRLHRAPRPPRRRGDDQDGGAGGGARAAGRAARPLPRGDRAGRGVRAQRPRRGGRLAGRGGRSDRGDAGAARRRPARGAARRPAHVPAHRPGRLRAAAQGGRARSRARRRRRAAVRALLRRHGRVRERPLGRGRRPLRGGGAPRRRDRAARRRRHLPRRARAGVRPPRRPRGRRARRRRARPGGRARACRGSRPRRCTPRATSRGAAARCRRRSARSRRSCA